jgi:hypothetical protein
LRRSAGRSKCGHEADGQRQHPHENHSTTPRSGIYTEPRAQAIGLQQGKEATLSKDRHGRACPGHPRLSSNDNKERGCPGQARA